jgi:hypothetical protein
MASKSNVQDIDIKTEFVGPPRWCWTVLWTLIALQVVSGFLAIVFVPH